MRLRNCWWLPDAIFGAVLVVGFVGFGALLVWGESLTCQRRWQHSRLATEWGPLQGCLVQVPDGRWLPDDRIREIDITPPKEIKK